MKYIVGLKACLLTILLTASVQAGGGTSDGDDFIVAFQPNAQTVAPVVELHLTSAVSTMVTVQYPVEAPFLTNTVVAVNPGVVTIVSLPVSAQTAWTPDVISSNAVHCFADETFILYLVNRASQSSDAGLGLPTDTLNTEYITLDYSPAPGFLAEFLVWAVQDNTTVTIIPTVDLIGHLAGVPFDVVLDRGEGYLGSSFVSSGTTGTRISADRPIGMSNGSLSQVPLGTAFFDQTFDIAQPVQTWGNKVVVANLPNRPNGSIYRIVASEDATSVTQDGVLLATLDAGQFFETPSLAGNHVFAADKPFFVAQYMTGSTSPGATLGDPSIGNMIPAEQYQSSYTFSTVGGNQFIQNYLTIIVESADTATATLDGSPIGAGAFTPIPGSGFSVALLSLSQGSHTSSTPGVHGITVEGYNQDDSYLYPGGALLGVINPGVITTVNNECSGGGSFTPSLVGTGTLQPLSLVTLLLSDAPPTHVAVLMLGMDPANLARKGCSLLFVPAISIPQVTKADGTLAYQGRWPAGLAPGLSIFAQAYVLDNLAPAGFAASNTVVMTAP